ncbi:MAG TPA: hypothetical protein VGE46_09545 [Bdellovibrio sp.]
MKLMKFLVTSVLLIASTYAQADGITWGKTVVMPIKKVTYQGRVYSGALIASEVEMMNERPFGKYIAIRGPRVLVYGMRMGLDEVVEIFPDYGNSPLCQNLGKRYTDMHDNTGGAWTKKLARFITKDEVEVLPPGSKDVSVRQYITCSDGGIPVD